jgi:hypothetical protein
MMIKLSASTISSWKACPVRYLHRKVNQIAVVKETDSRRMGTNWHMLQELYHTDPGEKELMQVIADYINDQYEIVPPNKTHEDWAVERTILLYSMSGFNWYYGQQPVQYEVIASEVEFEIPLIDLEGNEIEGVVIRGKIDQLVRDERGNVYVREFKSTSTSLDDESYWGHLNLDVQTSLYIVAANMLKNAGELKQYGIEPDDPVINGILYNVWHKPGIGPKALTQKDSKAFVETGVYCSTEFEVNWAGERGEEPSVSVNGVLAIVEPGKKEGTFAIHETPEMFGARLLQDITERPEFYFRQEELTRTNKEIRSFITELNNIHQMIKYQQENKLWFKDERQCKATFHCEYIPLCYNNIEVDPDNPPDGYQSIREVENETTTETK